MTGKPSVGPDSNWVITGFDNALDAKRRVEALLDSRRVPGLERLGVTFGHDTTQVYVVFDSLLRWTGRGVPSTAVEQISAALVDAFPGRAVYYTHDTIGFELASGEVTLADAVASGQAERVACDHTPDGAGGRKKWADQ